MRNKKSLEKKSKIVMTFNLNNKYLKSNLVIISIDWYLSDQKVDNIKIYISLNIFSEY